MTPALLRIFMVATAAVLLSVLTGIAGAAERVALVIGNAAYEHTTPLRNPRNDATDVARALEGLGFEVIEGLDLDKSAFGPKLREFAQAARGAQVTLFFYAGHGLQVEGENYLVPTDAKLADEVDLRLEAFELTAFLRQMRGGTNLVFLDACRDNPLAQSLARSMGPTRSSAIGRGLGRVETAGGTLIAYATQPGNVADDGEGRNSPFTGALLAHIATPGLSVHDLLASVTDSVVTGTDGRQQPWTHSSLRKPFHFKPVVSPARPPSDGAVEAYADAERLGTVAAFAAVVDRFPGSAHAERARAQIAGLDAGKTSTEVELLFWESVKDSEDPADIQAYLDRYPNGAYEVLGRNRLKRLEGASVAPERPAPASASATARMEAERLAAEREFWASVKASENPAELRAYLDRYPEGAFAVLARARLERLEDAVSDSAQAQLGVEVVASAPPDSPPSPAMLTGPSPEDVESSLGLGRGARRMVQAGLSSLGYGPGPADGLFGARTREAIRRYQGEKGFEETGYLRAEESEALVALGEAAARAQAKAEAERREAQGGADDAAFAGAKTRGTVEAYEGYMEAYPGGRHVASARRLRTEAVSRERERREKAPGHRFRDCEGCPELVVVPSGSFMMGSPPGEEVREGDEGPVHRVTIGKPIAVGVYEVTRGEFGRFVGETGHSLDDGCWAYDGGKWEERSGRSWRNPGYSQTDGHPVVCVNWEDAQAYVRWLSGETGEGYRLLSESEWEYVARGGARTSRYWGDGTSDQCAHANGADRSVKRRYPDWESGTASCDDGHVHTAAAGGFAPNGYGLHDVLGNVWEWVEDCWHGNYSGAPTDGSARTSGGDCSGRVLRGGSWGSIPRGVRSAFRGRFATGFRLSSLGFRVARTLD